MLMKMSFAIVIFLYLQSMYSINFAATFHQLHGRLYNYYNHVTALNIIYREELINSITTCIKTNIVNETDVPAYKM